ncbi:DsrE/DsrF-like family protein [Thiohalospira halophila DSM 15071]|uniref:DsrE/DsrF-like family protein n=1 Tax=Thiohalospira halophila DSM 15071 TaxID=1123397 RepID=A0A1I1U9E6_9GAMM|nr:DsrE family protein [Thiohalospira halophila]SFD66178.1 DsrE/DsrF-like family protein [Thiohalospira halophila DSM 15071]
MKNVRIPALAATLALPLAAMAEPQNNDHALEGVENGDVIWDITLSKPAQLTGQMGVIRETYHDLQENGIEPRMVLAFHGRNVHFLTEDLESVPLEEVDQVEQFNQALDKLLALDGVRVEACAIATRVYGADRGAIRDDVEVVGNTYVSNIGYTQKGYSIIGIR